MSNPILSASISTLPTSHARSQRTAVDQNHASVTVWIAVLAAMIGSFMAILNIQITNASLLNIEGGIGTGVDNGSWISTSYLIGEIVVIPLTDYLSRVFSFRRYMLASATLFTAHGVPDPVAAHQQASIALGNTVKHQALVMGFSDTFAVIGAVLVLAAVAVALTRKAQAIEAGAH